MKRVHNLNLLLNPRAEGSLKVVAWLELSLVPLRIIEAPLPAGLS